jgi:hypothetical protein
MTRHRIPASSLRGTLIACALVVAALAVAGCIPGITQGPIVYPDISGVITAIDSSANPVTLQVVWTEEMGPRSDFRFDVVDVLAPRSLKVGTGMGSPDLSPADLRVGDTVAVFLDGAVAESYPPKGTAWEIGFLGKHQGNLPEGHAPNSPESSATP